MTKNLQRQVQRVELSIGDASHERHGLTKAETRGERLEPLPIVAVTDDPEPRIGMMLENARPGLEQQVVAFVAFVGGQPADDEGRRLRGGGRRLGRARRQPGVAHVDRCAGKLRIRVPEALRGMA